MSKQESAIFGGGCFWCTEAIFRMLRGVSSVISGYADGAEVVKIDYEPAQITYHDLLTVFFGSHDPTTLNRQGNDVGPQYRSVIFYTNPEQKSEAEKFIAGINSSNQAGRKIVTEVVPLESLEPAEDFHQDYLKRNPGNPYCELVINPKLKKVQEKFAELLKSNENNES